MRIILMLVSLGIGLCLFVSCADDTQQKIPCTEDYNCDTSTQGCYQGYCTPKADIPNGKDAGGADKPATVDNPPKDDTPQDVPAPKDDPPKDDPPKEAPPKDDTPQASYPSGPYGADVDDVAIPLTLAQCDGKGTMSFEKFYKHPTIKVLLVTVHTGW